MDKVFLYWDNSNIFARAQDVAAAMEGEDARSRVRVHFRNVLELARAGREIQHAVAVGSIPPELRHVWNRLENEGVSAQLVEWDALHGGERVLQAAVLRDALDYIEDPGTAVLVTGDGAALASDAGLLADLDRMFRREWHIEVLSWRRRDNRQMRQWAVAIGKFVGLDDHYESVTFLERPAPGEPLATTRVAVPVDLARRA